MFVLTLVLAVILLGLIVWWLTNLRHGQSSEKPDETVRKAQRREL